jgi:hypothetical protein
MPNRDLLILPIGGQASSDVAPYFYDLMQFLPNVSGLIGNLSSLVASGNLTQTTSGDRANINFSGGCILTYYTWRFYQPTNRTLEELDGYRGYVGYPGSGRQFVSPLLITTQP